MAISEIQKKLNKELKYYYKNGLWNHIDSTDLFGLELENGETVYINMISDILDVMGSFLIYKDLEALGTCIRLFPLNDISRFSYSHDFASQDALGVILLWKDIDNPEENLTKPAIEMYKLTPGFLMQEIEDKKNLETIYNTLIEFKKLMGVIKSQDRSLRYNRLYPTINGRGYLPVFKIRNNKISTVRKIILDYKKKETPKVEYSNDLLISTFKRKPHYGSWILEIIYPNDMVKYDDNTGELELRNCIYLNDLSDGYEEFVAIETESEKDPEGFVNGFAKELLDFDKLPKEVYIRDQKTLNLLEDFLNKINVEIIQETQIPEMEELENRLLGGDENTEDFEQDYFNINEFKDIDELLKMLPEAANSPYLKRIAKKIKNYQEELKEIEDLDDET